MLKSRVSGKPKSRLRLSTSLLRSSIVTCSCIRPTIHKSTNKNTEYRSFKKRAYVFNVKPQNAVKTWDVPHLNHIPFKSQRIIYPNRLVHKRVSGDLPVVVAANESHAINTSFSAMSVRTGLTEPTRCIYTLNSPAGVRHGWSVVLRPRG